MAFVYPWALLFLAFLFGAMANGEHVSAHQLDLIVRGMTALILCSSSIDLLGYLKLRKCLFPQREIAPKAEA